MNSFEDSPKLIYEPKDNRPMHIVIFGSGSGSCLKEILEAEKKFHKADGNPLFQVKCLFSDRICPFIDIGKRKNIPTIYFSLVEFMKTYGASSTSDPKMRIAYEKEMILKLNKASIENNFHIDLIFLAGYMRLLHTPLLHEYRNRILNIHPADLTKTDANGKRKYVGINSVFDALNNGEKSTRSTVIIVDQFIDTGPILTLGPEVYYEEGYPLTMEKAKRHQEKQKRESDWPACVEALTNIAKGVVKIDNQNKINIEGNNHVRYHRNN